MIELETILNVINKEFSTNLKKDYKTRKRDKVILRYFYFLISRKYTKKSLESIGELLNKDHATVLNGLKKFDSLLPLYPEYLERFSKIDNIVNNFNDKSYIENCDNVASLKIQIEKLINSKILLRSENKLLKKKSRTFNNEVNQKILSCIEKVHDSNFDTFLDKLDALCELNKHEIRRR